jgi:hypothetical protein
VINVTDQSAYARRTARFAFAMLAIASSARGQEPRALADQTVPRELAEDLLSGLGGRTPPVIIVGALPAGLAGKLFVPPGARVLGGTTNTTPVSPGQPSGNTSSTAVIVTTIPVDSIVSVYSREQVKLGWSVFDRSQVGTSGFGFRDATTVPGGGPGGALPSPLVMCGNGQTLLLMFDRTRTSETKVFASASSSNMCSMMQQQIGVTGSVAVRTSSGPIPMGAGGPAIRWPVLVNPPNARSFNACPPENFSSNGMSAELSTPMTVDELFAHYGRQLADSGWKENGPATATRTWTKTDSLGGRQDLDLIIKKYPDAPRCRRLLIQTRIRR